MAPNVIAPAAYIAYDMQPPESLHRTKYQIKAKNNEDLEPTELEMLITMNVRIPLPNPNPHPNNIGAIRPQTSCSHDLSQNGMW